MAIVNKLVGWLVVSSSALATLNINKHALFFSLPCIEVEEEEAEERETPPHHRFSTQFDTRCLSNGRLKDNL